MQIAEVVRDVRPDVVPSTAPWGELQSQLTDVHAITGHLTRMAVRYCSDSLPQPDGYEPHHTKAIFYVPMMGMADTALMGGTGVVCDVWIDITPVVEKKIQSVNPIHWIVRRAIPWENTSQAGCFSCSPRCCLLPWRSS